MVAGKPSCQGADGFNMFGLTRDVCGEYLNMVCIVDPEHGARVWVFTSYRLKYNIK